MLQWIAWFAFWFVASFALSKVSKSKLVSIGGGFLVAIISFGVLASAIEKNEQDKLLKVAQSAGFNTYNEYTIAKAIGANTKAKYDEMLEEKRIAELHRQEEQQRNKELQRQKEAEEKRIKEESCKKDLKCAGEMFSINASVVCDDKIEKLAKYDFQWTDGLLEPKFSHYRWSNQGKRAITYIGDKIKYQNGFGAWQYYTYECDFDIHNETVMEVRVSPGRLR